MSSVFNIDFNPLITGFTGLLQAVINGISTVLTPIGGVLAAVAGVLIMLAVAKRIPVVGGLIDKVVGYVQSAF
jgi:hypothetical protein